jgi:hypothetical protein
MSILTLARGAMPTRDHTSRPLRTLARALHLVPRADESAAADVLGPEHELVNVLARRRTLTVQLLVTLVPLGFAAVGIARDVASAPVVLVATAIVQAALLLAIPYFRGRTRDLAEELIASGNGAARTLRLVEDEHRRLASRKERHRLARSLERLIADAERWPRLGRGHRPPPGVTALRFTVPEARAVVDQMRAERAEVRGVALTSRLLSDGGRSPLFGHDAEPLREELRRIRYLLAAPQEPHAEHDRLAA